MEPSGPQPSSFTPGRVAPGRILVDNLANNDRRPGGIMKLLVVAAFLLSAGCSTVFDTGEPQYFTRSTAATVADTYQCAFATVNQLGYSAWQADKDNGFFNAQKKVTGAGTEILLDRQGWDLIAIAVYQTPGPKGPVTTLKVTGGYGVERETGRYRGTTEGAPSDHQKGEITQILDTCAK
jgi:hypothetical protein